MALTTRARAKAIIEARKIFRLLDLPLELREMIYKETIKGSNIKIHHDSSRSSGHPIGVCALLMANKAVYAELKPQLYKEATFEVKNFMLQRNHSVSIPISLRIPLSDHLWEIRSIRLQSEVTVYAPADFHCFRLTDPANLSRLPQLREILMTLTVHIHPTGGPRSRFQAVFATGFSQQVFRSADELAKYMALSWKELLLFTTWRRDRISGVEIIGRPCRRHFEVLIVSIRMLRWLNVLLTCH